VFYSHYKCPDIAKVNPKISFGFGCDLGSGDNDHGIKFDIGKQKEMAPSILSPFSRTVATTIAIR
jgi:hypothetical protein